MFSTLKIPGAMPSRRPQPKDTPAKLAKKAKALLMIIMLCSKGQLLGICRRN